MLKTLYPSLMANLVLVLLCCGFYPGVVSGLGQILFHDNANGSMITDASGKIIGSRLIGQSFVKPEYFHGRPSSAGTGYDASNSSGSNLGLTNQKFADTLKGNVDAVLKDNPTLSKGQVPNDLVTASASGLDPQITPEGARAQVARVAGARHASVEQIQALMESLVEPPTFQILGESVVNVLALNIELDQKFPIQK